MNWRNWRDVLFKVIIPFAIVGLVMYALIPPAVEALDREFVADGGNVSSARALAQFVPHIAHRVVDGAIQ